MRAVGIVPAAGKSSRFGGVQKELLPSFDGIPLIVRSVDLLLQLCNLVIVISNESKIQAHFSILDNVVFIKQKTKLDLLGALRDAMIVEADIYYMVMPDTFLSIKNIQEHSPDTDLSLGVFETNKAGRFGYIVDGKIRDKDFGVSMPATAWGVLSWTSAVKDFFFLDDNLPGVLSKIMENGYKTWPISDYRDMANLSEYVEFLNLYKQNQT